MADANSEISRRIIEEIFNQGRLETADELIAPGAISHDPAQPNPTPGPQGIKEAVAIYRGGFPDLRVSVEDQCASGDLVCTRWKATGTNTADFWGMSATGRQATVTGITIDRISGGQVAETWTNWDALGLLQQLGVIPSQAPS